MSETTTTANLECDDDRGMPKLTASNVLEAYRLTGLKPLRAGWSGVLAQEEVKEFTSLPDDICPKRKLWKLVTSDRTIVKADGRLVGRDEYYANGEYFAPTCGCGMTALLVAGLRHGSEQTKDAIRGAIECLAGMAPIGENPGAYVNELARAVFGTTAADEFMAGFDAYAYPVDFSRDGRPFAHQGAIVADHFNERGEWANRLNGSAVVAG